MRTTPILLTIAVAQLLSACAIVNTAASVTGTVITTTVSVTGDVIGTAAHTASAAVTTAASVAPNRDKILENVLIPH